MEKFLGKGLIGHTFGLILIFSFLLSIKHAHGEENRTGGWLTYWQFNQGIKSIQQNPESYDDIFFFIGQLSPNGDPVLATSRHNYSIVISQLREQQKQNWLTVVNDVVTPNQKALLKDPVTVSRILKSPEARAGHISALIALANQFNFDGIDIDYENLRYRDKENFSLFIEELSKEMRLANLKLAVTVQPKTSPKRRNGAGANDWKRLCAVVDRLQIMLYNEHSGKTGPGPIATTAWMEKVLNYANSQCPQEKIVPSIKVLGASWSGKGVRGVTHKQAVAKATQHQSTIERTDADLVPYFSTSTKDGETTIYFEDETSIREKLKLLIDMSYHNAVLWRLGSEDPAVSNALTSFKKSAN